MTCYQRICQGQGLAVRSKKWTKIKISNWVICSCHFKEHEPLSVCAKFHRHRIKNDEDMALWKMSSFWRQNSKRLFHIKRYFFFTWTHTDLIFGRSIESGIGHIRSSFWLTLTFIQGHRGQMGEKCPRFFFKMAYTENSRRYRKTEDIILIG